MPKRTQDYHSWRLQKLTDPEIAAAYLNDAMSESREIFQNALRNVAEARQMVQKTKPVFEFNAPQDPNSKQVKD